MAGDVKILTGADLEGEGVESRLSPEKRREAERRFRHILLDGREVRSRYRMELFFGHGTTTRGLFFGTITLWVKGASHPRAKSADELVYFCPRCQTVILPDAYTQVPVNANGVMSSVLSGICHECGQTWPVSQLIAGRVGNLTVQGWADLVNSIARTVDADVDLLMKRHRQKILKAMQELKDNPKSMRADRKLLEQGQDYEIAIYPLSRLIDDTRGGSSLTARIRAFLSA